MVIKRSVGGQMLAFRLTDQELFNAFEEQQHSYDMQDVESSFDMYGDAEFYDTFGVKKRWLGDDMEDIAYEMRRNMDKYDMDRQFALEEAIRFFASEVQAVLEEGDPNQIE